MCTTPVSRLCEPNYHAIAARRRRRSTLPGHRVSETLTPVARPLRPPCPFVARSRCLPMKLTRSLSVLALAVAAGLGFYAVLMVGGQEPPRRPADAATARTAPQRPAAAQRAVDDAASAVAADAPSVSSLATRKQGADWPDF